ncbi:unnamed protein product [Rotaria sp. Silwood1]|nr:unnamed protein product [Rotaria sp. Silwood1]
MRRFDRVTYHPNNQTVDVGPGLVWDDVYRALAPYNITVIGGRFSGVGVAGLILGGGYSWKSNQYGLSIDNVFEYELVTPNGTIVYVNNNSYPDIFFGLKGGYNNFGIVTKFNLRAVPQNQVYGGCLYYTWFKIDRVLKAITNFQARNTDPKAQILSILAIKDGILGMDLVVFYDAPVAPEGIFKEFTDLQPIGSLHSRSLLSIVQCTPGFLTDNLR